MQGLSLCRPWARLAVALACAGVTPAYAGVVTDVPILGGTLIVGSDGAVAATYLGSNAGHTSYLYFGDATQPLFTKSTALGTTRSLGYFGAGTELSFRLYVSNTRQTFYTGPGSNNPDGLPHALAITRLDDGLYITDVGFEDLLGGGDRDYNDFMFRLSNVYDPPAGAAVPLPGSMPLMALGLVGLAGLGMARRGRASARPR